MRTRSRFLLPVVVSASLVVPGLLSGCTGDKAAPSAAGSSRSSSAAPSAPSSSSTDPATDTDAATDAPPFPGDTGADTAKPSAGARVTVKDVRIGAHEGFDRVVFEVGGTGTPGWDVRYVDSAVSQGSGKAVDMTGNGVLQVSLTGVGYPYDTGVEEYSNSGRLATAGTEAITQVAFQGTFEGTTQAFVGTYEKTPFRVYSLTDPVRIVVDVAVGG